ncbi:light-harvesting complex-like protein OHP1, chloroplastic [Lycium ferocissimum]|uniref:light-harvesting complex-like protein OHP1, chloroplastic n=1 Tax=Lycium ferocissimum TaxID=112874 RepID=UPI00281560DF|nr:light-harvesting complex-like protein OHP1, chloroplastic [Lycium ferocissimum]
MAATSPALSSSFLSTTLTANHSQNKHFFLPHNPNLKITKRVFKIQAAKLPAGVELPKEVPKLSRPFLGFTKTAEIWNSRACMIGLIGTFIVELILNKGILEMIGVEIGKGLDIPL